MYGEAYFAACSVAFELVFTSRYMYVLFLQDSDEDQPENLLQQAIVDEESGVERESAPLRAMYLVHGIVLSTGFEIFIGACIVINTILLAIEGPFIDEKLGLGLCICNVVSQSLAC